MDIFIVDDAMIKKVGFSTKILNTILTTKQEFAIMYSKFNGACYGD